jgi:hypothetical protein
MFFKKDRSFDDLKISVDNYILSLNKFGKLFDEKEFKELKDIQELFNIYEEIKKYYKNYLDEKQKLKDKHIDLKDNIYTNKFKEYHEVQKEYETKLLTLGINLKDRTLTKNDSLLNTTLSIEKTTTNKLKDALRTVIETRDLGTDTLQKLSENKEKLTHISAGLDDIDSELFIARKRITIFTKKLYTDKLIIGLTTVLVLGAATVGLGGAGVIKF